jgi:hypothetical protein
MKRTSPWLIALSVFSVGCGAPDATAPTDNTRLVPPEFASGSRIVHRASVGSHDFTPPGVDANFSLIALLRADGTASGQYNDQFGHGNGGVHVEVDCLAVMGNRAWIGGVAKGDENFEGQRVITEVVDNGKSANDPPDEISFSVVNPAQFGVSEDCRTMPVLPLFPLQDGQVRVE